MAIDYSNVINKNLKINQVGVYKKNHKKTNLFLLNTALLSTYHFDPALFAPDPIRLSSHFTHSSVLSGLTNEDEDNWGNKLLIDTHLRSFSNRL